MLTYADVCMRMQDWWSAKSVDNYKARSQCLADVFSSYKVQGRSVNGVYTLGEDSADAGGIHFAYEAFVRKTARSEEEKRIFFTSFAQTWCQVCVFVCVCVCVYEDKRVVITSFGQTWCHIYTHISIRQHTSCAPPDIQHRGLVFSVYVCMYGVRGSARRSRSLMLTYADVC
jgi:hypothetical protein